jgi:hypothetical protein
MAESDASETRTLDPVVVEALKSITKRVYHRRGGVSVQLKEDTE